MGQLQSVLMLAILALLAVFLYQKVRSRGL